MSTILTRMLTVFSFSILSIAAAAGAAESDQYGSAPPSLDFPTAFASDGDAAGLRKRATLDAKKNSWIREELAFLSAIDPFPSENLAPIDPIARKRYDAVKIGPAFRGRAAGSNWDYYRYVSYYDIKVRKERIYELPIQRAQCYEKGDLFASNNLSVSYSATVNASVSFQGLGLGTAFTKSRNFGTGHGTAASGGMIADYIPYALKQDWVGKTFIELYDSRTGKTAFLNTPKKESPWWVFVLWPRAAQEKYPMDFEVRDADWTFTVDRRIIEVCSTTSFGSR